MHVNLWRIVPISAIISLLFVGAILAHFYIDVSDSRTSATERFVDRVQDTDDSGYSTTTLADGKESTADSRVDVRQLEAEASVAPTEPFDASLTELMQLHDDYTCDFEQNELAGTARVYTTADGQLRGYFTKWEFRGEDFDIQFLFDGVKSYAWVNAPSNATTTFDYPALGQYVYGNDALLQSLTRAGIDDFTDCRSWNVDDSLLSIPVGSKIFETPTLDRLITYDEKMGELYGVMRGNKLEVGNWYALRFDDQKYHPAKVLRINAVGIYAIYLIAYHDTFDSPPVNLPSLEKGYAYDVAIFEDFMAADPHFIESGSVTEDEQKALNDWLASDERKHI